MKTKNQIPEERMHWKFIHNGVATNVKIAVKQSPTTHFISEIKLIPATK